MAAFVFRWKIAVYRGSDGSVRFPMKKTVMYRGPRMLVKSGGKIDVRKVHHTGADPLCQSGVVRDHHHAQFAFFGLF